MYLKRIILSTLIAVNLNTHAQQIPSYLPVNGLVGWWPFTGNANDSSLNGNHGAVFGALLASDRFGKANAAYSFNGATSRIDVPDASSLRCTKITMSVWVFNRNIAKTGQVIYKGSLNADGESYSIYNINNYPGAGVKVGSNCVSGVGWKGGDFRQPIVQGSWEHLVATYDGSSYKFYKNGALDTSFAVSGLMDTCIGGGLRFGYNHTRYSISTGDGFDGLIDDIGIWNRALTTDEINKMYYAGDIACGTGKLGVNVCSPQRNLHVKDVIRLEPRSFAPPNPSKGDIYFDGTTNKLRVYDGTAWRDCW